jgi:starch phosphorylase
MFHSKETFKSTFCERLEMMHGKSIAEATRLDKYKTLGSMIREWTSKNWVKTSKQYRDQGAKQVYYFSLEFLLGRLLEQNLINLGIRELVAEGCEEMGFSLEEVLEQEPDAGLGNGGLGRLAACFLDSLASLGLPGHGVGIRYKYGLFEQRIVNGYQMELPENWLKEGNVWEVRRSDKAVEVKFGGSVRIETAENGSDLLFFQEGYETVLAVPYDVPVIGYDNKTVNTLRLWSAESKVRHEDLKAPKSYASIVEYVNSVESISGFLYPDDTHYEGQLLRLKQQYFLVSAGLQSIVRSYKKTGGRLTELHKHVAIHVNDTHPVLAIPELMRILLDEEGFGWEKAWEVTRNTVAYTNHTTLSEALETWPVDMFHSLLPRIYQIVQEIDKRFCQELWDNHPEDHSRLRDMAIISGGRVRMAHLAIVGSHSVNGVAAIHTDILKKRVMKNFADWYPEKFNNKTNGITHRRWLLKANPRLAELITETIGEGWVHDTMQLEGLLPYSKDAAFQEKVFRIKQHNKELLAKIIYDQSGIKVDVNSIFDVQVKRMHAYKRQLLNIFHIMDLYNRLRENPELDIVPRTFIFGAKAAPGYHWAKSVIKLINALAGLINNDPKIGDKIKVVFMENYRVSLAERIIPAADVSEQISTASKEASGTGNMKFMMNGALTLGTLDGANIEIKDAVGAENLFIFGLTADEVLNYYRHGGYRAWDLYNSDPRIKRVVDQLINGFFSSSVSESNTIYDSLLAQNDEYFVLKDFAPYVDAHGRVDQEYRNRRKWMEMSIVNIGRSGVFSSDRTIAEYAEQIWKVKPLKVE